MLEFDAGFDADQALQDVREKVDIAKAELPPDTDEPRVTEINVALFPVLTVVLSGTAPERTLISIARDLQDKIEALPGVLEVDIGGDREEVMEVIADPSVMETYDISYLDLYNLVQRNNRLVAAGALDTGAGRMVLKVPGVIEDIEDVLESAGQGGRATPSSPSRMSPPSGAPSKTRRLRPGRRRSRGGAGDLQAQRRQYHRDDRSRARNHRGTSMRLGRKASRSAICRTSPNRSATCSATCRTT